MTSECRDHKGPDLRKSWYFGMMLIYCIYGLGASEAMFSKFKPERAEIRPLQLPSPVSGETIASYATRLVGLIDVSRPFCLLGQSFGGILAMEMARLCDPKMIILVSSVKNRAELPWYGRLIGRLRLHHLTPLEHPEITRPISRFLNGIETAEDWAVFKSFATSRDMALLKWSLDHALKWPGCAIPETLIHIHGTADRLLPARYVDPDLWIEGGTHFMMVSRGQEISALIDKLVTG